MPLESSLEQNICLQLLIKNGKKMVQYTVSPLIVDRLSQIMSKLLKA